jgi:hypothetical protein
MGEKSTSVIKSLADVAWFSAVGNKWADGDVVQAESWQDSLKYLTDYSHHRLYVLPTNQIRYLLREQTPNEFQKWSSIANAIRPDIIELVEKNTEGVLNDPISVKLMRDLVSWDIMHACMESEYDNVCSLRYFRVRVALLRAGHLPCGWQDDFPQGKHIIY